MSGTAPPARPRMLVLGVGNRLLRDDGVGLWLLERLAADLGNATELEFVDGGTQGLALLGVLEERDAVLVLDAVARGAEPGTVHVFEVPRTGSALRSGTAHESSVSELMSVASLLDQRPPCVWLIGIEPAAVRTGLGFSPEVVRALPEALEAARDLLRQWAIHFEPESAHA